MNNVKTIRRYLVFLIITLFILSCSTTKRKKVNNVFTYNLYINYLINYPMIKNDTTTHVVDFLESFNTEGDTLFNSDELSNFKVGIDLIKTTELKSEHYFFGDSIRVIETNQDMIFLPKEFKRLIKEKSFTGQKKNWIENLKINKDWLKNYDYQININKSQTKIILDKKCYFVEIIKTRKANKRFYKSRYHLYVTDDLSIPINNYEFLKLIKKLDFKGLVLEAKIWQFEPFGDNYRSYIATDFNQKKQNKEILKDFKFNLN